MAENRTYDEIRPGESASLRRVVTANDLIVFAHASGNLNPLHVPGADHDGDGISDRAVAPSMWVASLLSSVLGNRLPGPGTLYLGQDLAFSGRAHVGDVLEVAVRVLSKLGDGVVTLACTVTLVGGPLILAGTAKVLAPREKIHFAEHEIPELLVQRHQHFDRMLEACRTLPALRTAVVCPDDGNSLAGALLAAEHNLILPVMVGPVKATLAAAEKLGIDPSGLELADTATEEEAALVAVRMVHEGKVGAIMKGHLHTDILLSAILRREGGLRTSRRLSHVFVLDVPGRPEPILISDAAINIAPDLSAKVDIVQNAIDLARAIGMEMPRVGILSAVETVNPAIPSTIDAAALSKMAERGQIRGGIVDGPLAMDNAIDAGAARSKGITSVVAGRAEVLIVPNLESGNMLAKELTFIAHAECAGLVMGARVPVMLTSRADDDKARLASAALAVLDAHFRQHGTPAEGLALPPDDTGTA